MRLMPDFKQPSTWRGLAGLLAVFGIAASPELKDQIAIGLAALLSAIEIGRNEYATRNAVLRKVEAIELQSLPAGSVPAAEQLREPSTELRPRPLPPANDPTDDLPPPPGYSNR